MAKRFTDTDIWKEDWIFKKNISYFLFWQYIRDNCDHAGIWKPNPDYFEFRTKMKIDLNETLEFFNKDKKRIEVLKNGRWLLVDFFVYQYGKSLNISNRVHKSILNIYRDNGVNLRSIRGLIEDTKGVKDKDKDKDKDIDKDIDNNNINKKRKKKKKKVELPPYFNNDKFIDCLNSFKEHRKNIKKPMTEKAVELLINKLSNLSNQNSEISCQIMEQSIFNGWQGIFELKDNFKNVSSNKIQDTVKKAVDKYGGLPD